MTIQVYPHNEQEEKELLDFLKDRRYHYEADDDDPLLQDKEFLDEYNKALDEAEAEADAGNTIPHEEAKAYLANLLKQHRGS